uniref:Uncharacterized protein n=1 Tax=Lactuca sativa TaxID=4236 RepID=A0A9R1X6M7_LACSA|nr:hypothetical protein LSAT_V11C600338720 [Lactuca sativa]
MNEVKTRIKTPFLCYEWTKGLQIRLPKALELLKLSRGGPRTQKRTKEKTLALGMKIMTKVKAFYLLKLLKPLKIIAVKSQETVPSSIEPKIKDLEDTGKMNSSP